MIVYGDPQFTMTFGEALRHLRDPLQNSNRDSVDHFRTILIQTGQLEQAIEDCAELSDRCKQLSRQLTDAVARDFVGELENTRDTRAEAERLNELLDALSKGARKGVSLTFKVPEGFAFYALYPEQYHATAICWASTHSSAATRTALVLGLRSIGTTLSAVVAETLCRRGWETTRVTARPSGHPFSRHVEISSQARVGTSYALIVDEGPGLSGSSFAAAEEALLRAGFDTNRIFFFPGHSKEPGSQSPPHVRKIWQRIPRCLPAADNKLWSGKTMLEILCERASTRTKTSVSAVHDINGGKWRQFAFVSPSEWIAVAPLFERPKYLLQMSDGRRLLCKFTGLPNPSPFRRRGSSFRQPALLDECLGFSLFSWIEGERLQLADMNTDLAMRLGRHINQIALPFDETEQRHAFERLRHMAEFNTRELLGEPSATRVRELSNIAIGIQADCSLCYGDGRLAPHEFIRTPSGEIYKVDEDGPAGDHTIIGPQPTLWDIAGAIVEWNLTQYNLTTLLGQILSSDMYQAALPFYCASYAAFRAGLLDFDKNEDVPSEERVLPGSVGFYLKALESSLCSGQEPSKQQTTAIHQA